MITLGQYLTHVTFQVTLTLLEQTTTHNDAIVGVFCSLLTIN
jgi:hypothetical protein